MNDRSKFSHDLQLVAAEAIEYLGDFTHPAAGHTRAYLLPWPVLVRPGGQERKACSEVHEARFETSSRLCLHVSMYPSCM